MISFKLVSDPFLLYDHVKMPRNVFPLDPFRFHFINLIIHLFGH